MDNSTEDLPSESDRVNLKVFFSVAYLSLFLVGFIGNGIVIVMICNVLSSMRRSRGRQKKCHSSASHVFVYVLGLSVVDLLVIIHLPFLAFELLRGQWQFGTAMCKVYWFGESVNKLLSSFLMCVLSWDRYLAVCRPVNSINIRSNSVALLVLLVASLLAIVLLLPVLIQARVQKLNMMNGLELKIGSEEDIYADEHKLSVTKCTFDEGSSFILYTFFIGFVIPAVLITFFYSQVIYRLRRNTRNMMLPLNGHKKSDGGKSAAAQRVQQVTKRIVTVIFFYFLCWTPQWTLTMFLQFNLLPEAMSPLVFSALFFSAHLLVCFNSAANPILYAVINRELRAQHVAAMARKRQSITAATQVALDEHRRHSSIVSVEATDDGAETIGRRLSHFLAGIKLNLFNTQVVVKRKDSHSSKTSQTSAEQTREMVDSDGPSNYASDAFL